MLSFRPSNKRKKTRRVKVLDDLDTARHDILSSFEISNMNCLDISASERSRFTTATEDVSVNEHCLDQADTQDEAPKPKALHDVVPSDPESHSKPIIQRKVGFSDVTVREYPYCMCDNPSTPKGAPIGIDWSYGTESVASVDDYEKRPRRTQVQIRLQAQDRRQLLKRVGYSNTEIAKCAKAVDKARYHRNQTIETLYLASLFESCEKIQRSLLNATFKRSTKRQEREYLEPYQYLTPPVSSIGNDPEDSI